MPNKPPRFGRGSSQAPRKKRRKRKKLVPVIMFGSFAVIVWVTSKITGVPVFHEFQERARRVVERVAPVEPVSRRANRALRAQAQETGLSVGQSAFVRIFKQEAEMEIWLKDGASYRLFDTYPICKYSGFLGPKLKEGDRQAPEGFYAVTAKQLNPGSRHYKAFNLGFPNEYDRAHGRTGSALMVHGGCSSIGCYAMTDFGVAQIYKLVERSLKNGQSRVPVHVFPFRMTASNMSKAPVGRWNPFWEQLKVGYDAFEGNRIPPKVSVCGKRYVVGKPDAQCQAIAGW